MPDRLAEIRARLDAATTLPVSPHSVTLFPIDRRRDEIAERAFIAHAPADIAWLLDEVDVLRERVAILRAEVADLEDAHA
jgi:uncharacterized small protein (DUF1192 family)